MGYHISALTLQSPLRGTSGGLAAVGISRVRIKCESWKKNDKGLIKKERQKETRKRII